MIGKGSVKAVKAGFFVTRKTYQLMKFLVACGVFVRKGVTTVTNSCLFQSAKNALLGLLFEKEGPEEIQADPFDMYYY